MIFKHFLKTHWLARKWTDQLHEFIKIMSPSTTVYSPWKKMHERIFIWRVFDVFVQHNNLLLHKTIFQNYATYFSLLFPDSLCYIVAINRISMNYVHGKHNDVLVLCNKVFLYQCLRCWYSADKRQSNKLLSNELKYVYVCKLSMFVLF